VNTSRIIIVGGGAAGFFAAIACAEASPDADVTVLERSPHFLTKVRISGGGRCNVTHRCFEPRELTKRYPRGERALIAPYQRFQARDTVEWFESRGVKLKTEADGRMFPITDSSETIINCLLGEARRRGVKLVANCGVEKVGRIERSADSHVRANIESSMTPTSAVADEHADSAVRAPGFRLTLANGDTLECDRLLLATGGCRTPLLGQLAVSLGHTLEPPVPSLFTFHIESQWLRELAGVSLESAEASVPGTGLRERGALLVTHWGLSGPVILRLSAWGARALHELDYKFLLHVNWLPDRHVDQLARDLQSRRNCQAAKLVVNFPIPPLTARLWEQLVIAAGIARETRWSALSSAQQHRLIQQLTRSEFQVTGKSLNKDEFVTCGGVRLKEVDFKTMQSRVCPGLFFAGEVLDIDGITGGFNFQAAWTTGWIAGHAMAELMPP
jgi:predicted flavoprotein YhiN